MLIRDVLRLVCLFAAYALPLFATAGVAQAQGNRFALVIGNEDYPSQPGNLNNPHEDVARIADALENVGFVVTRRFDRTQGEIVDDVGALSEALVKAGPEAIGFFYYSGHGASAEVNGKRRNYIMPAKTAITSGQQLALRGVPLDQLLDGLSVANAKAVFFVSDACRNTLPWSEEKGGEESKAFNAIARRSGLYVAFAAADGQTTPDDGYFSDQLSRFIRQPGQTADRVFTLALREVAKRRPGEKLPFIADGLTTDVCFAACAPNNAEEEFWSFSRGIGTPDAMRAFLDRYPSSAHADEAAAIMKQAASPFPSVAATPLSASASARAFEAAQKDAPLASRVFRDTQIDGAWQGPEMIALPTGDFIMGSRSKEEGRTIHEGPIRKIRIQGQIAIMRHEVSWALYDDCVDAGYCQPQYDPWPNEKGDRPAVYISWENAESFAMWLSEVTGQTYRLPTEAEWEYAARGARHGATEAPYPWGADITHNNANYGTAKCCTGLAEGTDRWLNASPVGSFPPNAFGVYDMAGNVAEWVQDCWADNYAQGQPEGGGAYLKDSCTYRVLRGGSWASEPSQLRSASRTSLAQFEGNDTTGFRLVRLP